MSSEKIVINATVKEERGLWTVSCTEFPDVRATANTREDALAQARALWSEELRRRNVEVLSLPGDIKSRLALALAQFSGLGGIPNSKAKFELAQQALPDIQAALAFDFGYVFELQPLMEALAQCYAATCDVAGVDKVCGIIYAGDRSLALGRSIAESAVRQLEWASHIVASLRESPGITQFALREKLGMDKGEMTSLIRRMEALGLIRRAATDRTFHLFLAE
jgi:hypothetical protein